MVGDLARTQSNQDDFSRVGMLAWFDVESMDYSDTVEVMSLDVPNTFRITSGQYAMAKSILSEYDIIHTHRPHSGFYGKLIAKRLDKPIVQTEHNNHVGYTKKGRIANGLTNVFADAVVCVSESVRESFMRWEDVVLRDEKISVIENGVDLERLKAARELEWSIHDVVDIDPKAVIIGSAGMLTEQKAHQVLVKAVDRANTESERPIELVISGDGELREELEMQVANAEYSDRLHLLGFLEEREQVYKMMHEIDIYAMPSRWEGFCVAALEAMAIGNACVFSDISEFKRPFADVARFHRVDDPESLFQEINSLVNNTKELHTLTSSGAERVSSEYTVQRTAERYLSTYSRIK